jgi:hypothetical protein
MWLNQDAALWAPITGKPDSPLVTPPLHKLLADHDDLSDHACAKFCWTAAGSDDSNQACAAANVSSWSRSATRPAQYRVRPRARRRLVVGRGLP